MSYLDSVLEQVANNPPSSIDPGFAKRDPVDPKLMALMSLLKGDPILTEACLAWVKQKKDELTVSKITLLRGAEWVRENLGVTRDEQ